MPQRGGQQEGSGLVLARTGSRFLLALLFTLQILGNSQPALHGSFERRILNCY